MNDQNSNLLKVIDPRFNEELYGFNNIEKLFLNILKNDKLLNAYILRYKRSRKSNFCI